MNDDLEDLFGDGKVNSDISITELDLQLGRLADFYNKFFSEVPKRRNTHESKDLNELIREIYTSLDGFENCIYAFERIKSIHTPDNILHPHKVNKTNKEDMKRVCYIDVFFKNLVPADGVISDYPDLEYKLSCGLKKLTDYYNRFYSGGNNNTKESKVCLEAVISDLTKAIGIGSDFRYRLEVLKASVEDDNRLMFKKYSPAGGEVFI